MSQIITAALLVIGDEILSGRTKDKNIGILADYLSNIGIELKEVRIVPDEESRIIDAVNALRLNYTYLFTTGGIGPTHDDITADCIAKAFDVGININEQARARLLERYKPEELTEARLCMARIPDGASLIDNPVSKAPGFKMDNVFVMAGVPSIMQVMLDQIGPTLQAGTRILVETIDAQGVPEGVYGKPLGDIAQMFPMLSIGSYPAFSLEGVRAQIVLRGKDKEQLQKARAEVEMMIENLKNGVIVSA